MKLTKRDIDRIRPTQDRSLLDREKVKCFEAKMRTDGWFGPPLVVLWDGWSFSLYTGHHRFEAAKRSRTIPQVIDLADIYQESDDDLAEIWESYNRPEPGVMGFYEMVDATVPAKVKKKYAMENDLGPIRAAMKKDEDRGGCYPSIYINADAILVSADEKAVRRLEVLAEDRRVKKSLSFSKARYTSRKRGPNGNWIYSYAPTKPSGRVDVITQIGNKARTGNLGSTLRLATYGQLETARQKTVRQIVNAHMRPAKTKLDRDAQAKEIVTLSAAHKAIERELVARMKRDAPKGRMKSYRGRLGEANALQAAKEMVGNNPVYVKKRGAAWHLLTETPTGKYHRINPGGSIDQVGVMLKAKYLRKEPDGKGGWKYYYKDHKGEKRHISELKTRPASRSVNQNAESIEKWAIALGYKLERHSFAKTGTQYMTFSDKNGDHEIVVRVADHGEAYDNHDISVDPDGLNHYQAVKRMAENIGKNVPKQIQTVLDKKRHAIEVKKEHIADMAAEDKKKAGEQEKRMEGFKESEYLTDEEESRLNVLEEALSEVEKMDSGRTRKNKKRRIKGKISNIQSRAVERFERAKGETMTKSEDVPDWVNDKTALLIREGKPKEQAYAIAWSMYRKRSGIKERIKAFIKARYIRRIPKPGGGYRYIYKEPGEGKAGESDSDQRMREYKERVAKDREAKAARRLELRKFREKNPPIMMKPQGDMADLARLYRPESFKEGTGGAGLEISVPSSKASAAAKIKDKLMDALGDYKAPEGLSFQNSHTRPYGEFEVKIIKDGQQVASEEFQSKDKTGAAKFIKESYEKHK